MALRTTSLTTQLNLLRFIIGKARSDARPHSDLEFYRPILSFRQQVVNPLRDRRDWLVTWPPLGRRLRDVPRAAKEKPAARRSWRRARKHFNDGTVSTSPRRFL